MFYILVSDDELDESLLEEELLESEEVELDESPSDVKYKRYNSKFSIEHRCCYILMCQYTILKLGYCVYKCILQWFVCLFD